MASQGTVFTRVYLPPHKRQALSHRKLGVNTGLLGLCGIHPLVSRSVVSLSAGINFSITAGIVEDSEVQLPVIGNNREVHQSLFKKVCDAIAHLNLFTPACGSSDLVDIIGDHLHHRGNPALPW